MSLLTTLARAEAVRAGRAQPVATVRHRHLSGRPLVLVPLTAAGEAAAPLGAMVGTDRDAPVLLTVRQPRDRDLRFGFLARLADVVLPYLESYADDVDTELRKGEELEVCADAPQILVPSVPGVDYVRLLGRSMRFRRTAEEDPDTPFPAPPRVPLLGRWLTHYAERARTPGSSLLLAMTELLGRHWATGQSQLEDQHLGALLAWIRGGDPEEVERGRDASGQLLTPPAGPATDPAFDNRLLAKATARFDAGIPGSGDEIDALLASQLRPTWDAVWEGVTLLRELAPGTRVPDRWTGDRWSYTGHRDRLRAGEPPQPRRDDATTAARKLASRERAQAELAAGEALDDPLVMASRRLAGEAFAGTVTGVEMAMSEGRSPRPRPLVVLETDDEPYLDPGVKAHRVLATGKTQTAEVVETGADADGPGPRTVVLRLTSGMGRGKTPEEGSLPEPGDALCFTLFEHTARSGAKLPDPDDTPWTHGGPPSAAPADGPRPAEAPDPVTAEDFL
ncbi:hypothetical protein SRB5_40720 [Streptomyces sp. RB5]|uniref:Uncharacterized protein n=1 Tax=Streptomyces smaragdinus TaxID=2585196 RepID=A0A7K0CK93_9ACTN|nr:hypothetical protein [Streptomyces smaragdinus]MQY13915.1 hypothetical protein [Streptomyces smaragdinus]